jgi:phenylpropionate dioxygenase-like ring-hydroxylating dioxygenase large terminal subunit
VKDSLELTDNWYIACQSNELRQTPIGRTILGISLVLFRGNNGTPTALLDRCPHRNVPLSKGTVRNDRLICKYHGWQFDDRGICTIVPGLCTEQEDSHRNAVVYPTIERDNFIWVYCQLNEQPKTQPYQFPYLNEPGFSTFCWQMECATSIENAAENFLDATHTHFVHSGLIRTDKDRKEMTVKITRRGNSVEAVYLDELALSGLIYQILAPGCREVVSIGRFILPSIAQLEYRTDRDYKIFISLFITPIRSDLVRAYTVVTFRWGLPNWLGRIIAQPLFFKAAQQDREILELQTANINLFEGESFVSTEIDVMRPHISYLLKRANRDNLDCLDSSNFEKIIQIKI